MARKTLKKLLRCVLPPKSPSAQTNRLRRWFDQFTHILVYDLVSNVFGVERFFEFLDDLGSDHDLDSVLVRHRDIYEVESGVIFQFSQKIKLRLVVSVYRESLHAAVLKKRNLFKNLNLISKAYTC